MPMAMEFCEQHEIPTYIGMTGVIVGFASIPIAVLGIMADYFSLEALFAVCLGIAVLMIIVFIFLVKEPRYHEVALPHPLRRW